MKTTTLLLGILFQTLFTTLAFTQCETIPECDQKIKQNPYDAKAYVQRGYLKVHKDFSSQSGDSLRKIAIEDFTLAIKIGFKNPEDLALAYFERGEAKHWVEDYKGAINDYNIAINNRRQSVPSNYYYARANSKFKSEDYAGALKDYNVLIKRESEQIVSIERLRQQAELALLVLQRKENEAKLNAIMESRGTAEEINSLRREATQEILLSNLQLQNKNSSESLSYEASKYSIVRQFIQEASRCHFALGKTDSALFCINIVLDLYNREIKFYEENHNIENRFKRKQDCYLPLIASYYLKAGFSFGTKDYKIAEESCIKANQIIDESGEKNSNFFDCIPTLLAMAKCEQNRKEEGCLDLTNARFKNNIFSDKFGFVTTEKVNEYIAKYCK